MAVATLIGDIIGSRDAVSRGELHERLDKVLTEVNAVLEPVSPLRITVGDEYQGAFATIGAATQAALRLRLGLLPDHDVRHGLGWGEVEVLQEEPPVEDGPGWWAARDAIHQVAQLQQRPATRHRRTALCLADAEPDPALADLRAAVDAGLLLRDHLLGRLDARSLSVLRGLLSGSSQRDLAASLDISPSAVSQRIRTDGLGVLVESDRLMGGGR